MINTLTFKDKLLMIKNILQGRPVIFKANITGQLNVKYSSKTIITQSIITNPGGTAVKIIKE